jgi:hypothetical protein
MIRVNEDEINRLSDEMRNYAAFPGNGLHITLKTRLSDVFQEYIQRLM